MDFWPILVDRPKSFQSIFSPVLYENNRNKWESRAKRAMKLAEVEANDDFGKRKMKNQFCHQTRNPSGLVCVPAI